MLQDLTHTGVESRLANSCSAAIVYLLYIGQYPAYIDWRA